MKSQMLSTRTRHTLARVGLVAIAFGCFGAAIVFDKAALVFLAPFLVFPYGWLLQHIGWIDKTKQRPHSSVPSLVVLSAMGLGATIFVILVFESSIARYLEISTETLTAWLVVLGLPPVVVVLWLATKRKAHPPEDE